MPKSMCRVLIALVVLALAPAATLAASVVTSPNDSRAYQYLVLDNRMQVLLVSDPASEQAAAALDVHVGSGSDPQGREGLAHFLEHMLFLGTEKYPRAGEYQEFIRTHGGSNNAYTSFDHTNYYFDVDAAYLEPALDRFAQFFTAPLFTAQFVERERQVVHSEYQVNIKNDGRRGWSARKQAYNPEHPMARFMVGSLETLADRDGSPVRDELIRFYDAHYSANIMALVVLGREPLGELERWVRSKFSAVPDRDARPLKLDQPLFAANSLAARLDIVPLKEQRQLAMSFPVPPIEPHYRTKPTAFIANLLGHEGAGSLLSLLKSKGWAEGLSAGAGVSTEEEATFNVSIDLTVEGMSHTTEIVAYVFQYIRLIEREGLQRWLFDEQKALADLDFRFQETAEPISAAPGLAASLQVYAPEDVLRGPYMMETFAPELIRRYLSRLTPQNLLLTVTGKGLQTDRTTPRYQADYRIASIPESTLARWRSGAVDVALRLPEANIFVSHDVELAAEPDASPAPRRLAAGDGLVLWHQNDLSFSVPRASFYFSVRSPLANDAPRHAVLTALYVRAVNEQLNEFSYPARLAGLDYSLYPHVRGLSVRISGYSDKQPLLLDRIVGALAAPRVSEEAFARHMQGLEQALRNAKRNTPYSQTISEARGLLLQPDWSEDERLAALSGLTRGDLLEFVPRLLQRVEVVALSHGNVLPERALAMAATLRQRLLASAEPVAVARARVVRLPAGRRYLRELDIDHGDSAIAVYYQGVANGFDERARFGLLSQILSSPFYHEMRTVRQLGYVVFASAMPVLDVPGAMLVVQSPIASPEEIEQLMEGFLADYAQTLESMPQAQFERHKESLLTRILEKEKRLQDRSDRYWEEIDEELFDFDSREELAAAVRRIGKRDFEAFYRATLLSQSPRKLTVQSRGSNHEPTLTARPGDETRERIEDPQAFKRNNSFFPRA